jgi:hypothetical protein
MLTEPEAWREIARRLCDRTYYFRYGLCWEAGLLERDGHVPDDVCERMTRRIEAAIRHRTWAAPPSKGRALRTLLALFLACQAETDG